MKKSFLTLILMVTILLSITSCKKDEESPSSNNYSVVVTNDADGLRVITLQIDIDGEAEEKGKLNTGESLTIEGLEKGVSYLLKAKKEGSSVSTYFESWQKNDTSTKTISIER